MLLFKCVNTKITTAFRKQQEAFDYATSHEVDFTILCALLNNPKLYSSIAKKIFNAIEECSWDNEKMLVLINLATKPGCLFQQDIYDLCKDIKNDINSGEYENIYYKEMLLEHLAINQAFKVTDDMFCIINTLKDANMPYRQILTALEIGHPELSQKIESSYPTQDYFEREYH